MKLRCIIPFEFEAVEFNEENISEIRNMFPDKKIHINYKKRTPEIIIGTGALKKRVELGKYIIKDKNGKLYILSKENFEKEFKIIN